MTIKIEMLRCFVIVAELGNISDAGERLGRTPSAISMTLKQLEENLGSPLFESDRKNRLTALGRFTLTEARREVDNFTRCIETITGDLAPISPNTQAVAFWAAMNSRGERHFSPECGWFSL